jgi:hypothetical protein
MDNISLTFSDLVMTVGFCPLFTSTCCPGTDGCDGLAPSEASRFIVQGKDLLDTTSNVSHRASKMKRATRML